ncbi:MAG: hypothetical protein R2766_04590 [Saprospiraceae bacterium]
MMTSTFVAYPSSTGRNGFDIIKIYNESDSVEFVSSLTTLDQGAGVGTQVNAVYEDGYVIFGGLTKKVRY